MLTLKKNNLKKLFTVVTATTLLTFLNACSSTNTTGDFTRLSRQEQIAQLNSISELEENGKIALISRYKKARFAVNCTYHYKKNYFSLEFTGPMGMQYAMLEVYANGTTFLKAQGKVNKGDSARDLLKTQFGLDIPVEDLPAIMVGAPKGELTYDEQGFVKTAKQGEEYLVTYKQYQAQRRGLPLPTNFEILTPFTQVKVNINNVLRLN